MKSFDICQYCAYGPPSSGDGKPCVMCPAKGKDLDTNAERIRSMSDEELATQLTIDVDGIMDCRLYLSVPTGKMLVSRAEAVRITLDWLRQPEEGETIE